MTLTTKSLQYVTHALQLKHHGKAQRPDETGSKWKLKNFVWNREDYLNRIGSYQETTIFCRARVKFNEKFFIWKKKCLFPTRMRLDWPRIAKSLAAKVLMFTGGELGSHIWIRILILFRAPHMLGWMTLACCYQEFHRQSLSSSGRFLTGFRHILVQKLQKLLKAKNMDEVEKPSASQMLPIIGIFQDRGEGQKGLMTVSILLKESAANWSGTPHFWGSFPDVRTIYFFILV